MLIIVADNLVNDVLPVTIDGSVKEASIVQWLRGGQVGLTLSRNYLETCEPMLDGHDRIFSLTSVFQEVFEDVNSGA